MKTISLVSKVGTFAENKDIAREIRVKEVLPTLKKGNDVVLDFSGIESATQSFIHALISDVIRQCGSEVLDNLQFKSCNATVQNIISIVVDYTQEGM